MTAANEQITVLVVDDSPLVRRVLRAIFEKDPIFSVIGEAANGDEAVRLAKQLQPRLITMDLAMPSRNGLEAIEAIMADAPTRILVITGEPRFGGLESTFEAIRRGALELVAKPSTEQQQLALRQLGRKLARIPVIPHVRRTQADRSKSRRDRPRRRSRPISLVAIGASAGGPAITASIVGALPRDLGVPVILVQHLASVFAEGYVRWLAENAPVPVLEARPGTEMEPAHVYAGLRGEHLRVRWPSRIEALRQPPRAGHCPSIDVLFESVAEHFGDTAIGVLLTGMGRDGAAGLKAIADAGGMTIAQDEATSPVFGMPAVAIELGAAQHVLPGNQIGQFIVESIEASRRVVRGG